ncbi:MAG: aminotransferase class IV [bacterium]
MSSYCYLNGKILPTTQAKISINDIGVLRGYGVFDILRTYNGRPFMIKDHLDRLGRSASLLNLRVPLSQTKLKEIIHKLLLKNKLKEARIRIVLTGGVSQNGFNYNPKTPTLFILIEKLEDLPRSLYENGAKLTTLEYQRDLPSAKIINYQMGIKSNHLKAKNNALEILYTKKGKVLEGVGSNIFIFKKNTLITPKDNILLGTTRNFVIKLATANHPSPLLGKDGKPFKVEEREVSVKELLGADECFITSITKDILPIVQIDDKKISHGKVGENTKKLMTAFAVYAKNN